MNETKTALLAIKDTRRLLVERLPAAWDLLHDEHVVFPTREQFLLDWLLDAVFRLVKGAASTARVQHLMESESFWRLFSALLGGRRLVRVNKPVLPLFVTFIRSGCSSSCPTSSTTVALVKECMNWVLQRYTNSILGRAPLRQLQELFTMPAREVLLEERLRLLLAWHHVQPQPSSQSKVFNGLCDLVVPHMLLLSNPDLEEQVMRELVTNAEVIKELHDQLFESRESPQTTSNILTILRQLGGTRLLGAIVANAKGLLHPTNYRQLVSKLVELLREELPASTAVRQLAIANMASVQTDAAWIRTGALVTGLVEAAPSDCHLLRETIDLDVALLLPLLPQVLQSIQSLGPEEEAFLERLAYKQSETRQLDQLIMSMISNLRISLPILSLARWFGVSLARLHPRALVGIVAGLVNILTTEIIEETGQVNVTHFLLILANVNTAIIKEHIQEITTLTVESRLKSAVRYGLCSVLEEVEGKQPGSVVEFHQEIVSLAKQLRHAGCLLLSWAQARLEKVPSWVLSTRDVCIRYLPVLLTKNIIPQIEDLPVELLHSLLFWECLIDVDAFIDIYWDQPHAIRTLLQILPSGITLSERVALMCINRFGAEYAEKILAAAPTNLQPETSLVNTLNRDGTDSLRYLLLQRGWITMEEFLFSRRLSTGILVKVLSVLNDAQARLFLDRLLVEFPSDDLSVYEALGTLSKCIPNLYQQLLGKYALTDAQQWQLAASFYRHGDRAQVGLDLEDALRVYFGCTGESPYLPTPKDVIQFTPIPHEQEGEEINLALSQTVISLLQEATSDCSRWPKLVPLLDVFLTQPLAIQNALCPLVDTFLLSLDPTAAEFTQILPTLGRLLQHRLLCGGTNIGHLQREPELFDQVLLLVNHLHSVNELVSILSSLLKFHWSVLVGRRPLLIAWFCHLIGRAEEAPRRISRLLADFATIRQTDQHFYIGPLLLKAAHCPLSASVRAILTPALCLLIRHLDQRVGALKAEGSDQEKYFDIDPLHRLMAQAETDDAKAILKMFITTYLEGYKFTGKA